MAAEQLRKCRWAFENLKNWWETEEKKYRLKQKDIDEVNLYMCELNYILNTFDYSHFMANAMIGKYKKLGKAIQICERKMGYANVSSFEEYHRLMSQQ
jgi:hypothetical protein